MAIEIVDLPIENSDFPSFFVGLPEGIPFTSDARLGAAVAPFGHLEKPWLKTCHFCWGSIVK